MKSHITSVPGISIELSMKSFYNISRVLPRILKIGVKEIGVPEKIGVLPYFSIGTFEKVGVGIKKLE